MRRLLKAQAATLKDCHIPDRHQQTTRTSKQLDTFVLLLH